MKQLVAIRTQIVQMQSASSISIPKYDLALNSSSALIQFDNSSIVFRTQARYSSIVNSTFLINNSNCLSTDNSAPKFHFQTLSKGLILICIGLVAIVGNVVTITSVAHLGRQLTSVYVLLIHLSIADLFVTTFCIIGEAVWTLSVQWYGNNLMCKLFKFMQMFALYLSTFTIVVIGFDRLFAVRFPMRRVKARVEVNKFILGAYILSGALALPQAIIFRVNQGPFEEEFYQCVTYGFYTAKWQEQLYTAATFFFMFVVPLVTLIITYAATFATISRSSKDRVCGDSLNPFEDARRKVLQKAKIKSLWITVVIVSTFILCWTPYYISMIISVFLEPSQQLERNLHEAIFFFGSSTAAFNPIIYGVFHLKKKGRRPASFRSSKLEVTLIRSTFRRIRYSYSSGKEPTLRQSNNFKVQSRTTEII